MWNDSNKCWQRGGFATNSDRVEDIYRDAALRSPALAQARVVSGMR